MTSGIPSEQISPTLVELQSQNKYESKIKYTSFIDAVNVFGIDLNSVVGIPGVQSTALECTLRPEKVAKIGSPRDLFTEAVCLALLSDDATEITVSPGSADSTFHDATKLCIIVPRVFGKPYQVQLSKLIESDSLPPHAKKDLINILKTTSINAIAQKISLAEKNGITLNDIQLRQVVSNSYDNREADFVDFSAAYVDFYDDHSIVSWLSFLDRISTSDLEVNKYNREVVLHHFHQLIKDPQLLSMIGGDLSLKQIDQELVQWQAELLLRKTATAIPRDRRSKFEDLAFDIDYAKPPTPLNKLKDLIFGSTRTAEWQNLPKNLIESINLSRKYLEESNVIAWMTDNPQDFTNTMVNSLQKAFLTFGNMSFNRANNINWQDIKDELTTLATARTLTKPVGQKRREVINRIKTKLIRICVSSDKAVADGNTSDLAILSNIMEQSEIEGVDSLGYQVKLLCDMRHSLASQLNIQSENIGIEQYFAFRDEIKKKLHMITELITVRTKRSDVRPIPEETLELMQDLTQSNKF